MEAYKKVALRLHSFTTSDQQWLLSQLPELQSQKLLSLINELESLGIPKASAYLSDVEQIPKSNTGKKKFSDLPAYFAIIESCHASAIDSLLSHESHTLVAIVLQAYAWSWRQEFMNKLNPERKQSIVEASRNIEERVTTAVVQKTLQLFAQRLQKGFKIDLQENEELPVGNRTWRFWSFVRRHGS